MKTFLKPLTMAEEQYYLQQYQRGDMEAKNILIERNLRLVAHVVKKYQGTDQKKFNWSQRREICMILMQ